MAPEEDHMHGHYVPAIVPLPIRIVSMTQSLLTLAVLAACLVRRIQKVKNWKKLALPAWILIIFYADSFLFVLVSGIVKDIGTNESRGLCQAAIFICLVFYMSAKVLVYYFLVEKAHVVQSNHQGRLKDKLYIFNCFGMMIPYIILVVLNFYYRISYINNKGVCIIGMEHIALIPLVTFDIVVNVYLTILFLIPLRRLYSWKSQPKGALHTIAYRTFVGSCCTLAASVTNIVVMLVFNGEAGWLCFMACNADVLFSVLVLHWVTSTDHENYNTSTCNGRCTSNMRSRTLGYEDSTFRLRPNRMDAIITSDCLASTAKTVHGDELHLDKIHVMVEQDRKVEDVDGNSTTTDDPACEKKLPYSRECSTDGIIKDDDIHHSV